MSVETTPIDIARAIIRETAAETELERDRRHPPCHAVRQRIADQRYQLVYDAGGKVKQMAEVPEPPPVAQVPTFRGWRDFFGFLVTSAIWALAGFGFIQFIEGGLP